jgi:hypothetical protein
VYNPKVSHGNAFNWLGSYLQGTKDKGIKLRPEEKSFNVYINADFAVNWNKEEASKYDLTVLSRYGYSIRYMGCPILWAAKFQTELALSSTESGFIGLFHALCTTSPLMALVKELKAHGYNMGSIKKVHVKCLRITQEQWKSLKFLRCNQEPNTLTSSIITFVIM